ncbi:MAG: AbrB/MazE/SpoVT family DNA-binding domain-containing protein [Oscillospiraceae bacterium]|nr:AbrB/MazE/SpoVT family DNA-binding domain-containing protein [Oscillospiraceae bacterium]
MKSISIVRKIDKLGRIVLPVELRKTLGITENDDIEIAVDGRSIVLRKHEDVCIFCGSDQEVTDFHGKNICAACLSELRQKAKK